MPHKQPPKDKQFKPGQSGNPGGRPKGKGISKWIRELLELDKLPDPATLPLAGQLALARIRKALKDNGLGDAEFVTDRTEGKVAQTFKLEGDSITAAMTDEQKRQAAKNVLDNLKPSDGA